MNERKVSGSGGRHAVARPRSVEGFQGALCVAAVGPLGPGKRRQSRQGAGLRRDAGRGIGQSEGRNRRARAPHRARLNGPLGGVGCRRARPRRRARCARNAHAGRMAAAMNRAPGSPSASPGAVTDKASRQIREPCRAESVGPIASSSDPRTRDRGAPMRNPSMAIAAVDHAQSASGATPSCSCAVDQGAAARCRPNRSSGGRQRCTPSCRRPMAKAAAMMSVASWQSLLAGWLCNPAASANGRVDCGTGGMSSDRSYGAT